MEKPIYRCWCGAYATNGVQDEWYCRTHFLLTAEGQEQVARLIAESSKET
jgi:hypothetical protein